MSQSVTTCPPHHWKLEDPSPGQARVNGICRYCLTVKDFAAFDADFHWRKTYQRRSKGSE